MKHYEALDIDVIGKRLKNDLPLTMAQCKWLYTQRTGHVFAEKKRCRTCFGDGTIESNVGGIIGTITCPDCKGK